MYLLNTDTLSLERFPGESTKPKYAILSHRWGNDEDEASFQDVGNGIHLHKRGWKKIASACGMARAQGHKYLWADTCCINKVPLNNKEQTDAINSMYAWYKASEVCYAYLEDVVNVKKVKQLQKSQWFQRGWTLQELFAPQELLFFSRDWKTSVDRFQIPGILETVAGVVGGHASFFYLDDGTHCIDQVMSWASKRKTTKPEDVSYSLLGLFKLQSTFEILYGEGGARAFIRLQEQLIQTEFYSGDLSIFDWTSDTDKSVPRRSMLATSPKAFEENECWIFMKIHSGIIKKCKTLMGVREDDDKGSGDESEWEDYEGSEDDVSEGDGNVDDVKSEEDKRIEEDEKSKKDEESEEDQGMKEDEGNKRDEESETNEGFEFRHAIDNVLVAEDGLHMSVWLLELTGLCEMVGDASYEIDLGSVLIDNYGSKKTRNMKMFVSKNNESYFEAFNLVPSFRRPAKMRFYIMLVDYLKWRGDKIRGILLVSRENELEKHRVIMDRRIGVAPGSMNNKFSDPVLTDIVVA